MTKTSGFSLPEVQVAHTTILMHLMSALSDKGILSSRELQDQLKTAASAARQFDNPINQAAGDFIEHVFAVNLGS